VEVPKSSALPALREQQVPHRAFSTVRNDKGFLARAGQGQDQSQKQRAGLPAPHDPSKINVDGDGEEKNPAGYVLYLTFG
jgi:hypothetical protein